jgi:hypothetical protein
MYQFCDFFDNYNANSELYELVSGTITLSSAYALFAPRSGLPEQAVKFAGGASWRAGTIQSGSIAVFLVGAGG